MLTLPQTLPSQGPLPMSENAVVIGGLLSTVGAMDPPDLDNIDLIEDILCAAEKYEIPLAIATMRMALFSPFLHVSPIRLYGIAYRMSWEKEVKLASSRTLTLDLLSPEAMAELVTLEAKHRDKLIALHRRRRDALAEGLDNGAVFYANLRGALCNQSFPSGSCTVPLDHGAWFAFKYAFLRRADRGAVGEVLDADFYRMPELWALKTAYCIACKRAVYDMSGTLENLQLVVDRLPRSVEVSSSGHAFCCWVVGGIRTFSLTVLPGAVALTALAGS